MTRPMPEPPTCDAGAFPHERTAPHACLIHARNYHANSKRLTTPECAAHEWQADAELERAARNLDDDYYNPHRFRLRAEYERRLDEWDTWVEFTLRPHALEES